MRGWRIGRRAHYLFPALAVLAPPAWAEDRLTLSTGIDYSHGKYGGSVATDIIYVPFSAKYETGRWTFKLTAPWLRITGPGTVVGGGEDVTVVGSGGAARRSAEGLGDLVAAAGYTVLEDTDRGLLLDLTGKIKFGTADEARGLGTGRNDYALQADGVKSFGTLSALGSLGYRVLGDPAGVNLRNVWFGSVGAAWRLSASTSAGALLDARQAALDGGKRQQELTAYVAYKSEGGTRLQGYVVRGLADGSPDWGVGAALGTQF